MDFWKRARELEQETVAHRRYLHTHAEVGLDLPKTRAYVMEQLQQLGLNPRSSGHGVVAQVGQGERTLLLRADMDGLAMKEESGLPFACPTGQQAHTCGHDLHTAMLLTAAKLLKEREKELKGTVRLMFQPGEECLLGAADMIQHGVLEDPRPMAALAFHVGAGDMPPGTFLYNDTGVMMQGTAGFRVTLRGKGGHGAYPHKTADPIHMGAQLLLALDGLVAREVDPAVACALTVGQFQAGTGPNIIPEQAVLQGSLRANHGVWTDHLAERLQALTEGLAALHHGQGQVTWLNRVPPLVCDPTLTQAVAGWLQEGGLTPSPGIVASASDDFALIAREIPSCYVYLTAGFADIRGTALAHNPRVLFHEGVLPLGAAGLAVCAWNWLNRPAAGSAG